MEFFKRQIRKTDSRNLIFLLPMLLVSSG